MMMNGFRFRKINHKESTDYKRVGWVVIRTDSNYMIVVTHTHTNTHIIFL